VIGIRERYFRFKPEFKLARCGTGVRKKFDRGFKHKHEAKHWVSFICLSLSLGTLTVCPGCSTAVAVECSSLVTGG